MQLPSELEFASFLQYSPSGQTQISRQSKDLCYAIKNDRQWMFPQPDGSRIPESVIHRVATVIRARLEAVAFLQRFLGPDRVLVPMPRSAPQSSPGALWPTLRICEELVAIGLGKAVIPALVRHTAVTKAATAPKGQRPMPPQHYESARVDANLPFEDMSRITLVDDVITRGSTMVGMYGRLSEAFADSEIRCFAVVRTMSGQEVTVLESPANGTINYRRPTWLHREP
jgi:hypothetical protein